MTQEQKILTLMHRQPVGTWFIPPDFMRPDLGDLFVGYEASARLSELAKNRPDLIWTKRQGKYLARCLRKADPDYLPQQRMPV